MKILILTLTLFLSTTGCITSYSLESKGQKSEMKDSEGNSKTTLSYHIKKFPILDFGGYNQLKSYFRNKFPLAETEEVDTIKPTEKGYYCLVETDWARISAPALIFGYISLASATFLPAWSTEDGYDIKYTLYNDGQKVKDFKYSIKRSVFLWFFTFPFLWINLATDSEAEMFSLTAKQFANDVKPFIK